MKPGDIVWIRGAVVQSTPHALLVAVVGPKGNPITIAVDPSGPIEPEAPPVTPAP